MIEEVAFGFLLGSVLDVIYSKFGFDKYKWRLEILEHFHWGMILIATQIPFCIGVGIALIVGERFQDHPFSLGSGHERLSLAIGIGLVLGFVLAKFV